MLLHGGLKNSASTCVATRVRRNGRSPGISEGDPGTVLDTCQLWVPVPLVLDVAFVECEKAMAGESHGCLSRSVDSRGTCKMTTDDNNVSD